ncbi:MAG: hypothetical protein GC204_02570 [Chloroflexi bacterium]|nr:hypothetical protein [Chloroflexota bacterium]
MYWNSSDRWHERWQGRRHHGGFWIAPLIFLGLIILTHGWILFLPLMMFAAFAFFGFVLPRIMYHMHDGNWQGGDWSQWAVSWGSEKRKRQFGDWHHWDNGPHARYDEKPKRDDDIEYV